MRSSSSIDYRHEETVIGVISARGYSYRYTLRICDRSSAHGTPYASRRERLDIVAVFTTRTH